MYDASNLEVLQNIVEENVVKRTKIWVKTPGRTRGDRGHLPHSPKLRKLTDGIHSSANVTLYCTYIVNVKH